MSETLEEFIRRDLQERYLLKMRQVGWWCPRCDVFAPPWMGEVGPGWCCLCGMDPLVEGPPKPPRELRGILG